MLEGFGLGDELDKAKFLADVVLSVTSREAETSRPGHGEKTQAIFHVIYE